MRQYRSDTLARGISPSKLFIALFAVLFGLTLCLSCVPCSAYAGTSSGSNVVYNDDPTDNLEDQTIVGEGANNNFVLTNTSTNPPSTTGFVVDNLPIIALGVIVVCGGVVAVLQMKRNRRRQRGDLK